MVRHVIYFQAFLQGGGGVIELITLDLRYFEHSLRLALPVSNSLWIKQIRRHYSELTTCRQKNKHPRNVASFTSTQLFYGIIEFNCFVKERQENLICQSTTCYNYTLTLKIWPWPYFVVIDCLLFCVPMRIFHSYRIEQSVLFLIIKKNYGFISGMSELWQCSETGIPRESLQWIIKTLPICCQV